MLAIVAPVSAAGRTAVASFYAPIRSLPSASTSPARGALPGGMAHAFISESPA